MEKLRGEFSLSEPPRLRVSAVSSRVVRVEAVATGASFTGVTVRETVAGAEVREPSETVKTKESVPWKSASGW